ncbi:hypothetical protein [Thermomonospora catenispora]|uniref:hypothetical protein n=1 Tax=Thermomonospora catenispora TaxID=2493090 RepID=UPI0011249B9A|nr:hypothetical protein [Thermomonospora catenispora]TNY37235.1 hypothetical protein EIO00_08825 [Thermomonospora catenispora]
MISLMDTGPATSWRRRARRSGDRDRPGGRPPWGAGARRGARRGATASDTVADERIAESLTALEDALWLLTESERTPACALENAVRRHDHVADLRRLVHRLQELLLRWEGTPP